MQELLVNQPKCEDEQIGMSDISGVGDDSNSQLQLPLKAVDRTSNPPIRKRVNQPRNWLAGVCAALAVVAVAGWYFRNPLYEFARDKEVSETTVANVAQNRVVFALGRIEPQGEVISVAGPSGSTDTRIESLCVAVGDQVDKGALLATLDNHDRLQSAVNVAAASLEQAKTQLVQTRVNAKASRDELNATLESQRATLKNAQVDSARHRTLVQSLAISEQEFDTARLLVDTADKKVKEAEARLARYASDVEENVDVQVARANIGVAKANLQQAETQLAQSTVYAPSAGRILEITLRPGERIGQTTLLKMGKIDSMMVRAEVYESDTSQLVNGMKAVVRAPAISDALHGTLETIGAYVKQQSITDANPAANTDARVIETWIQLDANSSLRASRFVNMQVRVEFIK
jgi:HlyD family secretion protein